ncbi:DEKNAAC101317 [Brettanomyces naardenensis]|uniref:Dolichyl-diphosphooligosaccharide--protein glycosyltransferase subunit OST2 n=1 Tax=Brettanomyces naardenensis TaxID=13370 RepID=A0A448YHS7_BRENA|nr:DEKNAAC101317 [Brettanomyces naardenensis]
MAKRERVKPSEVTKKPTMKSGSSSSSVGQDLAHSIKLAYQSYLKGLESNQKLRLIDTFLGFLVALGALQFIFCLLVGTFPFNAFLAGFISTVGQFVLTVSLRLQIVESNQPLFVGILPERAFGDYIFASLLLHFVVIHFIN